MKEALVNFVHRQIVVDTRSTIVYIGTLEEVLKNCIVLSNVDVHDAAESTRPKERYIMDSKTTGIKANRDIVYVGLDWILSFSALEDIKEFG